jgi:hypothetical protein
VRELSATVRWTGRLLCRCVSCFSEIAAIMLGMGSGAALLGLFGGMVCLRGHEAAYGGVRRCDAWGGEGGLASEAVAELVRSSAPGTQLCFEVGEDVEVLQQLSVPAGVALEVRGRGGVHAPVVSAAGLREGRAITVARGARLVLHALVVADAPHGAVWSSGGDVRVSSCSFVRNGAVAAGVAGNRPAARWSTAYAGSVLGLTAASRVACGSGRSSLGVQAAAGAAGMLLLPSSVTAHSESEPLSCCRATPPSSCCYSGKYYDSTNATKSGPLDGLRDTRDGGAIWMEDSNLEVKDSSFEENSAHKGGAIFWSNIIDATNFLHISDSIFRSNQAREADSENLSGYAGSGGAVYVKGSDTTPDVDPVLLRDVDFTSNVAYSKNQREQRVELAHGGALSIVNTHVIAQRCNFIHNGVAENRGDQHAYGGAVAVQATVPNFKVTLDSCSFERNDAKEGLAIYTTERCLDEDQCGDEVANSGGVTLAVVNCSFAENGQGGVMTGIGFDAYEGQLFTIVSDSSVPLQYVESTGLAIEDIDMPGRPGAKTESCATETATQQKVCPRPYFGRSGRWRRDHEVEDIFDLSRLSTTPVLQCADCSADRPSDCDGFELGVRCTTWAEDSAGDKVAVCAPNGYGTECEFCGFFPDRDHSCGLTPTGAAAGTCIADEAAFLCDCNPGWDQNATTQRCDIDIDECWSGPCQNGGTCIDSSELEEVAPDSYRCECIAGWGGVAQPAFSGPDCEIDVDECASTPCLHSSFCIESRLLEEGAGAGGQMSSGGVAYPPVELQIPQPACAVQQNWPPASWNSSYYVPEPNYEKKTVEDLTQIANQMYSDCRSDIETLVGKNWGEDVETPAGVVDVENFDVDGTFKDELIKAFKSPQTTLQLTSKNVPFNLITIWCMVKGRDMTLWPWWCDETRRSMGACADVTFTYVEYGEGDRRRYASSNITDNRTTFAPFLIEQLGQQAYNLGTPAGTDVQPTLKLTQALERLECRALGGCCPAFDNTVNSTSLPFVAFVDPSPTDSRRTTDCEKEYRDQCSAGNGGLTPDLVPGTGLYENCLESSCRELASGGCVYSDDRVDKWQVSAVDYFDMVQAEETWAEGQLSVNCRSGFDFPTHDHAEGRQYYREELETCRPCISMVPVGAFECWCAPGWGWDNAPTWPRDVYETSTGKRVIEAPPIDTRVGVDNCDYQQDNCYDWELETQPCLNGGTCVNQVDDYKCECTGSWLLAPGWTGKQCQICDGMLNIFCEDRWITLVVCIGVFFLCAFVAHKR